jgi:hypothetical protein
MISYIISVTEILIRMPNTIPAISALINLFITNMRNMNNKSYTYILGSGAF